MIGLAELREEQDFMTVDDHPRSTLVVYGNHGSRRRGVDRGWTREVNLVGGGEVVFGTTRRGRSGTCVVEEDPRRNS